MSRPANFWLPGWAKLVDLGVMGDFVAGGVGGFARGLPSLRDRLRIVKVRELIRLIEVDGWRQVRTTGGHRHFKHLVKPNAGDDIPMGTLKAILMSAALERKI